MTTTEPVERFFPFLDNTQQKYTKETSLENHNFLSSLQQFFKDDLIIFYDELDGNILSVAICLRYKDEIHVYKTGQQHTETKGTFSTFITGYYEVIHFALRHDLKRIWFGTGSYRYKILRGARPISLFVNLDTISVLKKACLSVLLPFLSSRKYRKHTKRLYK